MGGVAKACFPLDFFSLKEVIWSRAGQMIFTQQDIFLLDYY